MKKSTINKLITAIVGCLITSAAVVVVAWGVKECAANAAPEDTRAPIRHAQVWACHCTEETCDEITYKINTRFCFQQEAGFDWRDVIEQANKTCEDARPDDCTCDCWCDLDERWWQPPIGFKKLDVCKGRVLRLPEEGVQ